MNQKAVLAFTFSLGEDALLVHQMIQKTELSAEDFIAAYSAAKEKNPEEFPKNIEFLTSSGLLQHRVQELRENKQYFANLVYYLNSNEDDIKFENNDDIVSDDFEMYEILQQTPVITQQMARDTMVNEYSRIHEALLTWRNAELEKCSQETKKLVNVELANFKTCLDHLETQTMQALNEQHQWLSEQMLRFFEQQNKACDAAIGRIWKYRTQKEQIDEKIVHLELLKSGIFTPQHLPALLCCAKALQAQRFAKACIQSLAENITHPQIIENVQLTECKLVNELDMMEILQLASNDDMEKVLDFIADRSFKLIPKELVDREISVRKAQLSDALGRNPGQTYSFVGTVESQNVFDPIGEAKVRYLSERSFSVYGGVAQSRQSFVVEQSSEQKPYNMVLQIIELGDARLLIGLETNEGRKIILNQDGILEYDAQIEDCMLRLLAGDELQFLVHHNFVELFYNQRFLEFHLTLPLKTLWFKWHIAAHSMNGKSVELVVDIDSQVAREWTEMM